MERSHIIVELLAHLQFLRQLRDETTAKRLDGRAHPTFGKKEKDRILDELSTLIKEKVRHVEDLRNPYARETYYERNGRITGLLRSLKNLEAGFASGQRREDRE